MKKSLSILATVSLFTGGAIAQSSVTAFGAVDLGMRYASNQGIGGQASMISGGNATSRIGFRGVEDLGNGHSAGFWLESGISADTGSQAVANQFWDRQSYLFLKSHRFGELRLGRDLTQVYKIWSAADPFGQVGIGSILNLYPAASSLAPTPISAAFGTNNRNATNTTRANNMLAYSLPGNLGGWVGGAFVTMDERSVDTTPTRGLKAAGMTLGYAQGPLSVMAGYARTRSPNFAANFTDTALHGIYDFRSAKLSVANRHYTFQNADQNIVQLGLWVPLGAAGTIKASFGRLTNKGTIGGVSIDHRNVNSFGLGYQHNLSKRTSFYASLGILDNGSASAITYSGSRPGMAAGGKSRSVEAGLRHFF